MNRGRSAMTDVRTTGSSVGCACLMLACAAVGQRVEAQQISDSLAAVIDSAPRVRVRLPSGWFVLEHPRIEQDRLSFAAGRGLDGGGRWINVKPPLSLAVVREIQLAAGNRVGKGAVWGGGVGAVLGFVLAIGAASEPQSYGTPTGSESAQLVVGLGAAGALIGALIGSRSTHWITVSSRP
jgi:hypothetical protein